MKIKVYFRIVFLVQVAMLVSCSKPEGNKVDIVNVTPTLDEVSGIWISADTLAIEPSIRNFRGTALLNRDMTSLSWFVSAPYSGGHHTGVMKVNGQTPEASLFRWQPCQALRKGKLDGLEIESSTRMMVENDAIMWTVQIKNTEDINKDVSIDLDMIAYISQYKKGDWKWWYPYTDWDGNRSEARNQSIEDMRKHITEDVPVESKTWPDDEKVLNSPHYPAMKEENTIFIEDKQTPAISAFSIISEPDALTAMNSGGKASWNVNIKPGESKVIKYLRKHPDTKSLLGVNNCSHFCSQSVFTWSND